MRQLKIVNATEETERKFANLVAKIEYHKSSYFFGISGLDNFVLALQECIFKGEQ
ncbi:hypothetical protein DFO58_3391 [Arthrobacter sp. AG1021]|nr:hypothetical protein DFO58_3391 [Arthrobacter sp. AG1021]